MNTMREQTKKVASFIYKTTRDIGVKININIDNQDANFTTMIYQRWMAILHVCNIENNYGVVSVLASRVS